jgi:hypothetical protein
MYIHMQDPASSLVIGPATTPTILPKEFSPMKSSATTVFLFAFSRFCFAGDSVGIEATFGITDYKPAGFRTQSLEVSPSLFFGSQSSLDTNINNYVRQEYSGGTGTMSASAAHYVRDQRKTSDLEMRTSAHVAGSVSASSHETSTGNGVNSYNQTDPGFNYSISNSSRIRRYVLNNVFIEGAVSPSILHQPDDRVTGEVAAIRLRDTALANYQSSKSIDKYRHFYFSSEITGSVGTGWIADMTGAAIALHMTDCVTRLRRGSGKFSNAQLQDLACAIDRLRRRRIFDSRIANIESVDTLCQILVAEKLADTATARLAIEINDIWNYGFSQPRYWGREFKVSPIVTVTYDETRSSNTFNYLDSVGPYDPSITTDDVAGWPRTATSTSVRRHKQFHLSYGAIAHAGFSKPYGRHFELDGSIEISGTMNTLRDSLYSNDPGNPQVFNGTYPNATGGLSVVLSWFPTLRSTVTLYNKLEGSGDFYFRSLTKSGPAYFSAWEYSQRRLYSLESVTSLSASYFVSPRCSYGVWGTLRYGSGSKRNYWNWPYGSSWGLRNLDFSVGTNLTYALY